MNSSNNTRQIRPMVNGSRRAFTLIELMVVVGIIAVLMGIVLPVLSNVRQSLRTVDCAGNQGRIAQGFVSYGLDHNGWLPAATMTDHPGMNDTTGIVSGLYSYRTDVSKTGDVDVRVQPTSKANGYWYGQGLLLAYGYIDGPNVFYCPEEKFTFGTNLGRREMVSAEDVQNYFGPFEGSYAYRGGYKSQKRTKFGPLNVSRNSGGLAILADNAHNVDPQNQTSHKFGFNVAYLDTHVEFHQFDKPIVENGMPDLWNELNAFWD